MAVTTQALPQSTLPPGTAISTTRGDAGLEQVVQLQLAEHAALLGVSTDATVAALLASLGVAGITAPGVNTLLDRLSVLAQKIDKASALAQSAASPKPTPVPPRPTLLHR